MLPVTRRRRNGRGLFFFSALKQLRNCSSVSWESRALNAYFGVLGQRYSRFWKIWFSFSAILAVLLMVIFLVMFSMLLLDMLIKVPGVSSDSRPLVTFMVPGINVPWVDVPYMMIATIFSVCFHELGHAIAATSQGVPVEYFAVFLVCCIPGALVALNDENLKLLSPLHALRIYSAGIWHNIVCCAGCYLLLNLFPVMLWPLYVHNENPVVLAIDRHCQLARDLSPGDLILEVSGKKVQSREDWIESLIAVHAKDMNRAEGNPLSQVFCVPMQSVHHGLHHLACSDNELPFNELDCTNVDSNRGNLVSNRLENTLCLKMEDVTSYPTCAQLSQNTSNRCICPKAGICLSPVLNDGESLVLIRVQHLEGCFLGLSRRECQKIVLFSGNALNLIAGLHLGEYWPRSISLFGVMKLYSWKWLPSIVEKLTMYILGISLAMAVMNSAPVFYLDGEAILGSLISLSCPYTFHRGAYRWVLPTLLTGGSVIFGLFCLFAFLESISAG